MSTRRSRRCARPARSLCATDLPDDPSRRPCRRTGPFLYLRLRRHDYDAAELAAWAARLAPFLADGLDVFVFFRHDEVGRGPELALELRDAVAACPAARRPAPGRTAATVASRRARPLRRTERHDEDQPLGRCRGSGAGRRPPTKTIEPARTAAVLVADRDPAAVPTRRRRARPRCGATAGRPPPASRTYSPTGQVRDGQEFLVEATGRRARGLDFVQLPGVHRALLRVAGYPARMSRRAAGLALVACLIAVGCGQPGPTSGVGSPAVTTPSSGSPTSATPSSATGSAVPATLGPSASAPATASPAAPAGELALALEPVVDGLSSPVDVEWRPSAPDDLFVVEQEGRIRIVRDGKLVDQPFLDIAGLVTAGGEQGLLGLAFPADPEDPGSTSTTRPSTGHRSSPRSPTTADDPIASTRAPSASSWTCPIHTPTTTAGCSPSAPMATLYVATGDGGGGGDPWLRPRPGHAARQDPSHRRLGRHGREAATRSRPTTRSSTAPAPGPRSSHYGLRNPWRFRFDRATDDLWIGDVGPGRVGGGRRRAGRAGGQNFGWNVMEGRTATARPRLRPDRPDPAGGGLRP